ncbi:MAG: hypothetical protein RLY16_1424 [Bacteroidota bacterium]
MKRRIFIVAALMYGSQLQAQQDSTRSLDEVVVTANKFPQKQSSTGKVLSVINRQTLQRNTGRSLAQLLNEQAGLVINSAQNPLGTNPTTYLRGAGSANTLILVDGVPVNDASGISGEFDLNQFSVDQIERVEILKGAQSVLYGSDAVAGVINIITRKGTKAKAQWNAVAAAGSYGTFKGNAGVNGGYKAIDYSLQYSRTKTDGFSAASGNEKINDRDGMRQDVLGGNLRAQLAKNWSVRVGGQYARYKADVDDAAFIDDRNNIIHNKNLQLNIQSVTKFKAGSITVNLAYNKVNRLLQDLKNIPADPNDYDPYDGTFIGKSLMGEAYGNFDLHKYWGLLVGFDTRKQEADITSTYSNLGSDQLYASQFNSFVSLYLKNWKGISAEAGVRYTHHTRSGDMATYTFNPSYTFGKGWKLFSNISTGFRAPTLYNIASEYGNTNLKPEKSVSLEGGIQYQPISGAFTTRLTWFNRTIKDVIVFNNLFVPPYGQYGNANSQKDHGLELEATIKPNKDFTIGFNYAYVYGRIHQPSELDGKDSATYNLYRRPKHVANLHLDYNIHPKWFASLGFRWIDQRIDQYYNSNTFSTELVKLDAYHQLDFYLSYQVKKTMKLFIDARNITNQNVVEVYGYNSRKFNAMGGLMLQL